MEEAVRCALAGDCIVYPTTTQPALGCLPESACLDQLYRLKGRASDVLVSIGVASLTQAETLVEVPDGVRELLDNFPEGSLTVILRAHNTLDSRLGGDSIAIRVVAHPLAKRLLEATGPLTATSANRSGEDPVTDCDEAARLLSNDGDTIECVSGSCPSGRPSTLIVWYSVYDSTESRDIEVLREGVVSELEVRSWLKKRT
jgi:tRNA threonylcarbamoyl adenosine modification protein (Sua5/YciO/YrdC/YwlC family)